MEKWVPHPSSAWEGLWRTAHLGMLTPHSQRRAEPASPSSANKPEIAAPPQILPEAKFARAGSSSTPIDPADTDDPRRAREEKSESFCCQIPDRRPYQRTS